jgi:hypothetical protein
MDHMSAEEIQAELSSGKYIPSATKKKLQARLEQLKSEPATAQGTNYFDVLQENRADRRGYIPPTYPRARVDAAWHRPDEPRFAREIQTTIVNKPINTKFDGDLSNEELFPDLSGVTSTRMCLTKSAPSVHHVMALSSDNAFANPNQQNYKDMLSKSTSDIGTEVTLHLDYNHIIDHINKCALDRFILRMLFDDSEPVHQNIYNINRIIQLLIKYILHIDDLSVNTEDQKEDQTEFDEDELFSTNTKIKPRFNKENSTNKYLSIIYSEMNLRKNIVDELEEIWHTNSLQKISCNFTHEKFTLDVYGTNTLDALSGVLNFYKVSICKRLEIFMIEHDGLTPKDNHYTYHFDFELDPASKIGLVQKIRSNNGVVKSTYHNILVDRVNSFSSLDEIQHRICESVSSSGSNENLVIIYTQQCDIIYITYTLPKFDKIVRLKIDNYPQGSSLLFSEGNKYD